MGVAIALSACGQNQSENSSTANTKPSINSDLPTAPLKKDAIALAGPFGLAKGLSAAQLTGEFRFKPLGNVAGVFAGNPPRPVEGISEYAALATKNSGLCKIMASTPAALANDSGDQVKATVDRLADSLRIKYGDQGVKTAYISDGTFSRNPDMWMIGLKQESVSYAYTWDSKAGAPLPNDLSSVEVSAEAISSSKAFARIVYTFNNFPDCLKEMKAAKAENL